MKLKLNKLEEIRLHLAGVKHSTWRKPENRVKQLIRQSELLEAIKDEIDPLEYESTVKSMESIHAEVMNNVKEIIS